MKNSTENKIKLNFKYGDIYNKYIVKKIEENNKKANV